MLTNPPTSPSFDYHKPEGGQDGNASTLRCPRCNGELIRVRRRLIDKLLSIVIPVRRFRCVDAGCIWEGNVRRHRNPTGSTPSPT